MLFLIFWTLQACEDSAVNPKESDFTKQKIAFISERDDANRVFGEIYIMNTDGSGHTNISKNPSSEWAPVFQP